MGIKKWNEERLKELVINQSDSKYLGYYIVEDISKLRKRNRIYLKLECPSCNKEYNKQLDTFIKSPYKICPQCVRDSQGKDKRIGLNETKKIFSDYGFDLLSEYYLNSWTPMLGASKEGFFIETTYNNLKSGCKPSIFHKKNKHTNHNIKIWLIINNKDFLLTSDDYIDNNKSLNWKCTICSKEWETPWNNVHSGTGCPYCSESKGEKKIRKYLESNDIFFESQTEFYGLVGIGNGNLSYDFYIPKHNLLIEYQGEFHDGTAYQQTEFEFSRQQEHDKRKREYAKSNNINLLEIWYWDFERIEEILNAILN